MPRYYWLLLTKSHLTWKFQTMERRIVPLPGGDGVEEPWIAAHPGDERGMA